MKSLNSGWPGPRRATVLIAILLSGLLFFLVMEHRAHLLGAWLWLLLAACLLLHLLLPHGDDGGEGHEDGGHG